MARPTPADHLTAQTPVEEAAAVWLGLRLTDLQRHADAVGDAQDADAVHDMRVASRRLRAALGFFGGRTVWRTSDREVKRLQDALGEVRDGQVQRQALQALANGASVAERALVRRMVEAMSDLHKSRVKALHRALKRWNKRAPALFVELKGYTPRGRLGGHRMRAHLRTQLKAVEKRAQGLLKHPEDPERAHALRIALRMLRYQLELFEPVSAQPVSELRERLVPLQDGLGELHDLDVRRALLRAHRADGKLQRQALRGLARRIESARGRQSSEVTAALTAWNHEAVGAHARTWLEGSALKPVTRKRLQRTR